MALLRAAHRLLAGPAATGAPALCFAAANSSLPGAAAAFSSSRAATSASPNADATSGQTGSRGRTAGEAAHDAAESMGSKGQHAGDSKIAAAADASAKSSGFVASGDASPSPEAAGQAGGPGLGAMGDIVDAVGGAFSGDGKRVERAVEDLTHEGQGVSRNAKPPHTTSQDWPRGGLQEGTATRSDDSQAEVEVEKYEGTIPSSSPPKSPPAIDQDPPESVTAGPTPGYDARGGDNRTI
ncbi:hypothetical protein OEZ85_012333 [Tetradesmus obliquus]|uniref:SMP domain-containing protein n=1 Tax=Tetradesmus obliquus TaxID=3088 RepID=A0ABY8TXS9_TETOB|nr:hypothetical protein OEZ85_012333 [Tetradesmus obliquus]